MDSQLKFFDFGTGEPSNCGDVLDIEVSSKELGWSGVILEKGTSPHFYPNNVYTPYFYFALAIEANLEWKAKFNGAIQDLKTIPGDIWINPPKTPFSHQISEPCFFIILAVEEEVFLNAAHIGMNKDKLKCLNNYNVTDDGLKNMIQLFFLETQSGGKNGHTYMQNLLSLVTNYYINNYSNYKQLQSGSLKTSKINTGDMELIDSYIHDRLDQKISIEALAETLHYSKYYFLREFKKFKGITPYQYIIEKKIIKAKELLANHTNTISSVAFDLGFNDQSYFTNVFKNHFGLTPGQYQKQLLSP
jgi:AraC family transcriptional regulator